MKLQQSHGNGEFKLKDLGRIGENVIFERGVMVFHPENIEIGNNVYIGHNTILKGYYKNKMIIGDDTWIGQCCFFHSAGGISIGKSVGIGPYVKILTSFHKEEQRNKPLLECELEFKKVIIEDESSIGISVIILPGLTVGKGAIVGAGTVVTKDVKPYTVVGGVPVRVIRERI